MKSQFLISALALSILIPISALAGEEPFSGTSANNSIFSKKDRHVCAQDRKKFCGDVRPGNGRIAACMEEHKAELTAACREHRAKMIAERGDVLTACKTEIAQYCTNPQGVAPVASAENPYNHMGSATRKCLSAKIKEMKVNESIQFSDSCKAQFKEFKQARKEGYSSSPSSNPAQSNAAN